MRHFPALSIAVFLLGLVAPACANPADVLAVTLPSGMKVIIREGHAVNLVAVDIWVRAGSVNETPATNGVSHFMEHMVFKSTAKYGPGEIDRIIEGVGAELNAGTSKDWAHFYTTVAAEYLPVAMDVLSDAIMNPKFDPADIERERGVIFDELARTESDPSQRALRLIAEAIHGEHPYRLPSSGSRDSIGRLNRSDLVSYHSARYIPANISVVIAGDVSKAAALSLVKEKFAALDVRSVSGPENVSIPAVRRTGGPHIRRLALESDEAWVALGYPAPSVSQFKDVCALDVILAVLGDTYRGRLHSLLTSRGTRFTRIQVDFVTQREPTVFSVLVASEPDAAEDVGKLLVAELRKLAHEGLSAAEISYGKRLVEGSDMFEQETFAGQARALGLYESVGNHELALEYADMVRSLTSADVHGAARKYFGTDSYALVVLSPANASEGK